MCDEDLQVRRTVNLNIFARTLFSRNFAYENKTLAKWQNNSVVY